MLLVHDVLVSEELFLEEFVCNLSACKGECCVAGDAGAPLDEDELEELDKVWPKVKKYLPDAGKKAIKKQGAWIKAGKSDFETPLVEGKECAYTVFEKGVAKCGIEKAFNNDKIKFRKPISCHLYPIRINDVNGTDALNYDRWSICSDACKLGKKLKVPVYRFLKDPLIRKYGEEFYEELDDVAHQFYEEHGMEELIDS